MIQKSVRLSKSERKRLKNAYKKSLTLSGLIRSWFLKWGIKLAILTLLGWLLVELEHLDKFAPGKVYGVLFLLGAALILAWRYRRFKNKWEKEYFVIGWHLLARLGKIEMFFAAAILALTALSFWYFFK